MTAKVSGRKVESLPIGEERTEQQVYRSVRTLGLWVFLATLASVVLNLVVYAVSQDWRMLAASAATLLAGLGFFWARWLAGHRRLDRAALLVVVLPAIFAPPFVLLLSNTAWSFGLVAFVLPPVLARLVWPRRRAGLGWVLGLGGLLLTLGLDALLNAYPWWARFDVTTSPLWMAVGYTIIAGVVGLALFELWGAYRRITSIRLRLVVTFVLVVLVVGLLSGVVSVWLILNNARQQTLSQLESVVALKRNEIISWVNNLRLDLDALLTEGYEVQRVRTVIINDPLMNPIGTRNELRTRFQRVIQRTGRFSELFVLDLKGQIVLSTTEKNEKQMRDDQAYFIQGQTGMYMSPILVDTTGDRPLIRFFISQPVRDPYGEVIGVLVGEANPNTLVEILVARPGLGETGETFMVDSSYRILTPLAHPFEGREMRTLGTQAVVERWVRPPDVYPGYYGEPVLGVSTWLGDLEVGLLAERGLEEVTRAVRVGVFINIGLAVGAVGLAVALSLFFSQDIARPVTNLADVAGRVAAGEYGLEAPVEAMDEIGRLTVAFNSMTAQLRDLIGSLEARVAERTRGLQAVSEVTRVIISELEIERLLPRIVDLVRERFDLYYVGLFIVDEANEYAVLRAGTGEAGRQMLAQGWRLPVGGESMIGQCVATGEPGVKQTEGDQVVRFDNPLLPETRSELALPLRFGRRVIGAMTVQSTHESAFDEAQIALLQSLADQVAVAVQNARAFAETQEALERAQAVQRRYQGQAWAEYLRTREVTGYERVGEMLRPLGDELLPEVRTALTVASTGGKLQVGENTLIVPLVQGDRVLGAVGIQREDGQRGWRQDQIDLVETLVEQLLLAAENQRLIDATQRRAAREQLVRQIIEQMRSAASVQEILHFAGEALSRQLRASEVVVRLGPETRLIGEQEVRK